MKYTTINIQGNLISEEILQKIESGEAPGQQVTDFGFEPGSNIRSEIEYAWSRIKLDWKHFSDKSQNLPASDPYGTTLSRKWMEQFLSSIGFELSKVKAGLQGDNNQSYTISHVADNLSGLPVHIVGFVDPNNPDKNTLDIKSSGGTSRLSPHATVQEYLNVTEHVYGIAANGLFLRLIRDSGRLIKLTYVEFDLKRMLDEDKYSEFTLLYRLLHATRFPGTQTEADQCLLEKYYQESIETGNRIRDGLSLAVKESLLALGNGFLQHESNTTLREKIQSAQLSTKDYYRQLLRIIYRLLFLMVTEERDLVYDPEDKTEATQRLKKIYLQYYSIARLRKLSENRYVYESRFNDLWQGLVQTFQLFEAGGNGKKLGIQPLDGDLFSYNAIKDLQDCLISNKLLLECIRNMNEFRDEKKNLVNINYRSLDVEELGSVYEGLLDLHPVIENIGAANPAHINFTFHEGTDRKTTGSYYTRPELVNELIKSALIPVIEERLKEAERIANGEWRIASGEWLKAKFKQLILNISTENEKLSGIKSLANRDRINGSDLPIDQLISKRRIIWSDFSDTKSFFLYSGQYRRGLGEKQQQGVQSFPEDSQRKFKGIRDSLNSGNQNKSMFDGTSSTYLGNDEFFGQADAILTKIHLSEKDLTLIWKLLPSYIRYSLLANQNLLTLKVCDAAAGSGHMLLAAARTIAWYLARVQSGEENPAPSVYRNCLREVIQHCIYAVDINPDAVELCKLALWLEGHNSGKPLSFLDHKIRVGNSLVGVSDLSVLKKGIPDEAFNPVTGDDKKVCQELKKANAKYRKTQQITFDFDQSDNIDTTTIIANYKELENIRQDDVEGVKQVKNKFDQLRSNHAWFNDWRACNLWTAAFFWDYTEESKQAAPNSERLARFLQNPSAAYGPMVGKADALSIEHKFFHWPLEFPDVFEQGGFDVMLGNPPWEILELKEKEFFSTRDLEIAKAEKKSVREKLIQTLEQKNPTLYSEYHYSCHSIDAQRKFIQYSNRFNLTAIGRINTYSIFAENVLNLISKKIKSYAGVLMPTGIVTEDSCKDYFAYLINNLHLVSVFDFENREYLFPTLHTKTKFCLLTICSKEFTKEMKFAFYLTNLDQLKDSRKKFILSKSDFWLLNPNTKTCPTFRTYYDSQLTKSIYNRISVLIDENANLNPWQVSFRQGLFNMSSDSHLFRTKEQLTANDFVPRGNIFFKRNNLEERYLPLYEAKMAWFFDHRFGSYQGLNARAKELPTPDANTYANSNYIVQPWYWVSEERVNNNLPNCNYKWHLTFRSITDSRNERSAVFSVIPFSGVGNSSPLIFFEKRNTTSIVCLIGSFSSFVFDYCVRQKLSGMNMNFLFVKQYPVLAPDSFTSTTKSQIVPYILELIYTSWDIKAFADDVWKEADAELRAAIQQQWEANKAATGGHEWAPPEWCDDYGRTPSEVEGCPLPPFKWDEARRAILKAELDALYAHLYGLSRKQLRYILDPADLTPRELENILDPWEDVSNPLDPEGYAQRCAQSTFPGETFRVLKEKEIRQFGEYRTRRLVLEAWERLNKESEQ